MNHSLRIEQLQSKIAQQKALFGQKHNFTMNLRPGGCVNALDDLALLPVVAEKYGHTVQVLLRHYFKGSKENQILIDTRMKYAA